MKYSPPLAESDYTRTSLAARLQVSPVTLDRWARADRLPPRYYLNRSPRWRREDIDVFFKNGCKWPIEGAGAVGR